MTDWLRFGKEVIEAQPFSVFLGAKLISLSQQAAELALEVKPELKQQHGFVHGGVLSYLADNALTFAGGAALGGDVVVTAEYKINYIRPAKGEGLIAKATVVYAGKRQAVCRCDVFSIQDGQESLCATAQGTIVRMGGE